MPTASDDAKIIGWRVSSLTSWDSASNQPKAGRWHYAGSSIIYTSATPELAVLEALAHHRPGNGGYYLCCVMAHTSLSVLNVQPKQLPCDWRSKPALTRALGARWLQQQVSCVLEVPSAVCSYAFNKLINPAQVNLGSAWIEKIISFRFDRRLVSVYRR